MTVGSHGRVEPPVVATGGKPRARMADWRSTAPTRAHVQAWTAAGLKDDRTVPSKHWIRLRVAEGRHLTVGESSRIPSRARF
jgi:hypothetical protein